MAVNFVKVRCWLFLVVSGTCAAFDCTETPRGENYKGNISTTKDKIQCQKWSYDFPHIVSEWYRSDSVYPDGSRAAAGNKCRNPGGKGDRPWCYTVEIKRWEYCNIPLCGPPDATAQHTKLEPQNPTSGGNRDMTILNYTKEEQQNATLDDERLGDIFKTSGSPLPNTPVAATYSQEDHFSGVVNMTHLLARTSDHLISDTTSIPKATGFDVKHYKDASTNNRDRSKSNTEATLESELRNINKNIIIGLSVSFCILTLLVALAVTMKKDKKKRRGIAPEYI